MLFTVIKGSKEGILSMSTINNNLTQLLQNAANAGAPVKQSAVQQISQNFQGGGGQRENDDKKKEKEIPAINTLLRSGAVGTIAPRIANDTSSSIVGTDGNDSLRGTRGNDSISGLGGNDTINGNRGDDLIHGNNGDDSIRGGWGNDKIFGDAGNDVLRGGRGDDEVYGGAGRDTLRGDYGNDVLNGGAGNDVLRGGRGDDQLNGDEGNDTLRGDRGNDELNGGKGDDRLDGGSGNDVLNGGEGNDQLKGGRGDDILIDNKGKNTIDGGSGNDTVKLNDVIHNYYIESNSHGFSITNKHTGAVSNIKNVESFEFKDRTLSASDLQSWVDNQYRTADGTNNNLTQTTLGSANTAFTTIVDKDPERMLEGSEVASLPNVRDISNAIAAQTETTVNDKGLSDMFWIYGQFLDHDINLTPTSATDTAPIEIPKGDAFFDPFNTGTQEMDFHRSVALEGMDVRTQVNNITAFIDGSNIYGSSKEVADSLREFEGGKLTMGADNYMPQNEGGQYKSGDVRVNENAGLTSMHTLWAREHNRVADNLAEKHPEWSDEKLYQESRKWVVAEMQAVTANEFWPSLLGGEGLGEYQGYDSTVDPQISNSFATAAYRLGHTMLSPSILRLDEQGNEIAEGNLQLRDAFFQPERVAEAGVDPILRGLSTQTAQGVDPLLVDDVRNFLFGAPGSGGLDLASLNLQRGRDHGLPGYNDMREGLGLSRIESFDDPIFQDGIGEKLASVYDSPDDMDLWIAGLAEKSEGDSLVGSTFTSILKDQFERLRSGDRFWYENQFSAEDIGELNNTKLSDIIKRNTGVENIQDNVMLAPKEEAVVQVAAEEIAPQGNLDPQGLAGAAAQAVDAVLLNPQEAENVLDNARNAKAAN